MPRRSAVTGSTGRTTSHRPRCPDAGRGSRPAAATASSILDLLAAPAGAPPPAARIPALKGDLEPGPTRCALPRSARVRHRDARSRIGGNDTVTYWFRQCSLATGTPRTSPNRPVSGRPPATARDGGGAPAPPTASRRPTRARRDTVLGVDDGNPGRACRSAPDRPPAATISRPRGGRVGATTADPHAVDDATPEVRQGSGRSTQRHPDSLRRQLRADALQVGLAAAALRVAGVARRASAPSARRGHGHQAWRSPA